MAAAFDSSLVSDKPTSAKEFSTFSKPVEGKYEFKIEEASVAVSQKNGYLELCLTAGALDAEGNVMFRQWPKFAIPVSYNGNAPAFKNPKGLFRDNITAIIGELNAYDRVETDAVSAKKKYYHGDTEVKKGGNDKVIGEFMLEFIDGLTGSNSEETCAKLVGRRFYGELVNNGDYQNLRSLTHVQPEGVIYSRKNS